MQENIYNVSSTAQLEVMRREDDSSYSHQN